MLIVIFFYLKIFDQIHFYFTKLEKLNHKMSFNCVKHFTEFCIIKIFYSKQKVVFK